jgi:hypothetical protein
MAGGPKAGAAKATKPKETPPEIAAKIFESLWKKLGKPKGAKELEEHIKKVC